MEAVSVVYDSINSVLWYEQFWFPQNLSWKDMENHQHGQWSHIRHPEARDVLAVIPLAVIFFLLRSVLDNILLVPLGKKLGLKQRRIHHPQDVPELQTFYQLKSTPSADQIKSLANQLSWTTRKVERWFRLKRKEEKGTSMGKFCAGAYKLIMTTALLAYGAYVLYDEDFTVDVSKTLDFDVWPHFAIKDEFYWYYMLEMGYYVYSVWALAAGVRRSDFTVHVLHHLVTLLVMMFSWTANFINLGMLVRAIHSPADIGVGIVKQCLYAKYGFAAKIAWVVFIPVWVVTRLYVFPVYLVIPCFAKLFDGYVWPAGLIMIALLVILQFMHLVWTYMIIRITKKTLTRGELEDDRSDNEEDEDDASSDDGNCDSYKTENIHEINGHPKYE